MTSGNRVAVDTDNQQASFGNDEYTAQLRKQLNDERKKNNEIQELFDETMQNMEAQNRNLPTDATNAID